MNHQSLRVANVIKHPKFQKTSGGFNNDIAMVQLYPTNEYGECINFNDHAQPACLNKRNYFIDQNICNQNVFKVTVDSIVGKIMTV